MRKKTRGYVHKPRFLVIKKYQRLHDKQLSQWAYNLFIRVVLLELKPNQIKEPDKILMDEIFKEGFVQQHVYSSEKLVRTPTLGDIHSAITATEDKFDYDKGQLSKALKDYRSSSQSIDVKRDTPDLMDSVYYLARTKGIENVTVDISNSIYDSDFVDAPIQEHDDSCDYRLLRVNISAPEELIIADFVKQLKGMRAHASRKFHKSLNRVQLSKYCENMLLPYMDILIYYKHLKPDIPLPTDAQIAKWLFENDPRNVSSKLKDLTKKYLREVTSDEFYKFLKNQIVFINREHFNP